MFVAEHNLSFSVLDHLPQLLSSICKDSMIAKSIKCGRKKATGICKNVIAPQCLRLISEHLKNNWYSLIIDETTDVSNKQCLAVIVRHCNKYDIVEDKFLGLCQVEEANAEGLFHTVKNLLEINEIPLNKLLGFAADNCSVMQGNKKGVQMLFQKEVPDIYIQGCVCHSLPLCSSNACLQLPKSVEALARDIINYFSHSSKRQNDFTVFQIFTEIKPHKLLKLSQTRWLSLEAELLTAF